MPFHHSKLIRLISFQLHRPGCHECHSICTSKAIGSFEWVYWMGSSIHLRFSFEVWRYWCSWGWRYEDAIVGVFFSKFILICRIGIIERITPRLQHANSAVVISAVKAILHFFDLVTNQESIRNVYKKLAPPLITLLNSEPEIQYVALRNINLVVLKHPKVQILRKLWLLG